MGYNFTITRFILHLVRRRDLQAKRHQRHQRGQSRSSSGYQRQNVSSISVGGCHSVLIYSTQSTRVALRNASFTREMVIHFSRLGIPSIFEPSRSQIYYSCIEKRDQIAASAINSSNSLVPVASRNAVSRVDPNASIDKFFGIFFTHLVKYRYNSRIASSNCRKHLHRFQIIRLCRMSQYRNEEVTNGNSADIFREIKIETATNTHVLPSARIKSPTKQSRSGRQRKEDRQGASGLFSVRSVNSRRIQPLIVQKRS